MTDKFIPRHSQKIYTFGNCEHGLNINGTLTLSNGSTITRSIDSSKRRFGDCYSIEVPGHTYTPDFDVPSHLSFNSYALSSGFEAKSLYNTRIGYADKRKFIYCDDNKDRWLVTISPGVGGTATAITMGIALRKFGDFIGDDESYSYTLNVGNPAITTALNGYTYEVVNVSKTGNLAIIGLCLENSTTESKSTCIFDRQYGYPLAFIRLDLTSKTTQTASIYRSKTYCERNSSTNENKNFTATLLPYISARTEKIKKASKVITRTTTIYGEYKGYYLQNGSLGFKYLYQPTLPAATTSDTLDISYSWANLPTGTGANNLSFLIGVNSGSSSLSSSIRTIHVFIKDDNTLVDVECVNKPDSSGIISRCTSSYKFTSWEDVKQLAGNIVNNIQDNRIKITGDIVSNTGNASLHIDNYYTSISGNKITYALRINNSEVSSVSFNSYTSSKQDTFDYTCNALGTNSATISSTYTGTPDNSYTGPSAGNITAVPLTSYKNYKGWMSKGTYTIDGSKYVTPFIQLYTNNLVGMIEGNYYTSNPDNARWDTGSGGTMVAMEIYNRDGTQVSSGGTIDALTRYCSYQPKTNTFSGLYNVPVCYV